MNEYCPRIISCNDLIYATTEEHGDCDCACSIAPYPGTLGNFSTPDVKLHVSHCLQVYPLSKSENIVFTSSGSNFWNNLAVLNNPALELLYSFKHPNAYEAILPAWYNKWGKPTVDGILVDFAAKGFITSTEAQPLTEMSTILSVWLSITDSCNLRCTYCYLPLSLTNIAIGIGKNLVEAVIRSALAYNYSTIKLKYAGGEPLLCFPLIVELHRYARVLADQHNLALDGVILSNGTLLTAKMVEVMQTLGLRLMISLDGLGDVHNCQRPYADGSGSANDVIRAIDLALTHGLTPDISITVSGRNAAGLPELIAWVLERNLPFSLNFYRENDRSASRADLALDEERIIAAMLATYRVIEQNLPRRSLLASLADRANLAAPHLRPCSAGHSYLVFDTQGRVSKCQMDMEHPVTDVSDPDPLARVREAANGICNPAVEEKSECQDCQWRYWCAGGCPLQAYRATGRYDAQSPNCNIYRALYPEVIRLEGLRLLKYAALQ